MKIIIERMSSVKEEIDIKLPIYRQQVIDDIGVVCYSKVDGDTNGKLKIYSVMAYHNGFSELTVKTNQKITDTDFCLGRNKYKSTKNKFDKTLIRFRNNMADIGL
jgi:hypothetical protein